MSMSLLQQKGCHPGMIHVQLNIACPGTVEASSCPVSTTTSFSKSLEVHAQPVLWTRAYA